MGIGSKLKKTVKRTVNKLGGEKRVIAYTAGIYSTSLAAVNKGYRAEVQKGVQTYAPYIAGLFGGAAAANVAGSLFAQPQKAPADAGGGGGGGGGGSYGDGGTFGGSASDISPVAMIALAGAAVVAFVLIVRK